MQPTIEPMDSPMIAPIAQRPLEPECAAPSTLPEPPQPSTTVTVVPSTPTELDLSLFPAYFRQGTAADQLMSLHGVLQTCGNAPTVFDLATDQLPSIDIKRLTLLLEVMVSRKIVKAEGHGAQRQWSLV